MKPIFKLVANDKDVTAMMNQNCSRIEFRDESGVVSDEITLEFSELFKRPKYKDKLELWLGSKKDGLFLCGTFLVQTSKYTDGGSKKLEVTATSVDFSAKLKEKRSQTYEKISLGEIAKNISEIHNLKLKSDFNDIFIRHIEQTNESDLHFLKRVASEYNAFFTIKNDHLIFQKRIVDNKVSDSIPKYTLDLNEQASINIETSNKTLFKSCKAVWKDTKENKQKSVLVGEGKPTKVIKDSFQNVSDAKIKAQAALQKSRVGLKTGSISTFGKNIYAGAVLNLKGTYEDDGEYNIKSINHTLDDNGWNMSIEIDSL